MPVTPEKQFTPPGAGEVITSLATGNTYTVGDSIGEGAYGIVFACRDVWNNDLAVKVLKPVGTYDAVRTAAEAEFGKLLHLRHPFVTYIFDAFEYRDTFYIVTERCHCSLGDLFADETFNGLTWLMPIARCLLQAVQYLHLQSYVHQDIHVGNVFTSLVKDELVPTEIGSILFKLGDLGVARVIDDVAPENTRAQWMLPPEVLDPSECGDTNAGIDIYNLGLLFLQLAHSKELRFSQQEILAGKPREMALGLDAPLRFALEKALRRHVSFRTASPMELWRDLQSPAAAGSTGEHPAAPVQGAT